MRCNMRLFLIYLLHVIFLLCCLSNDSVVLDDAILDKDLYKVLGLSQKAKSAEIRKAYRKLAQIHHPDKVKTAQKEVNAEIFREIASAYEVLNNPDSRSEYDHLRANRLAQKKYDEKQQYRYQEHQHRQQQYQRSMEEQNRRRQQQFEQLVNEFQNSRGSFRGNRNYRPVIDGPIVHAGQVIFPFSPILTSPDHSHFALLDINCSLRVYKGNAQDFVRYWMITNRLNNQIDLVYNTPSFDLEGKCFAGVDGGGVLRVFEGHPEYNFAPIWESHAPEMETVYSSMYSRYYIELTSAGEMAVLRGTVGDPEPSCVWSSTSCNPYLSILHEIKIESTRVLKRSLRVLLKVLQRFIGFIDEVAQFIQYQAEDLWESLETLKMRVSDYLINRQFL